MTGTEWGNTFFFEGPEKNLEIHSETGYGGKKGFRQITREEWDDVLEQAQCKILSRKTNRFFDAYVLSESSLFVFANKVTLKTCGQTTLLRVLPKLIELMSTLGMKLRQVVYWRPSLLRPDEQHFPHTSFEDEVRYLNKFVDGSASILGEREDTQVCYYVADAVKDPQPPRQKQMVSIMMFGLDREAAQVYFSDGKKTAADVTDMSGIRDISPATTIDDHLFEPCGYSMNGLLFDQYTTIHITPESEFSYASFETTCRMQDYDELVEGCLQVFRPQSFAMFLTIDDISKLEKDPMGNKTWSGPNGRQYKLSTTPVTTDFDGVSVSLGQWVSTDSN